MRLRIGGFTLLLCLDQKKIFQFFVIFATNETFL